MEDVSVTIDGAACIVSAVSDTSIECATGEHLSSLRALVDVNIAGSGKAKNVSADAPTGYLCRDPPV